jgi:hypothetical protein
VTPGVNKVDFLPLRAQLFRIEDCRYSILSELVAENATLALFCPFSPNRMLNVLAVKVKINTKILSIFA